MTEDLNDNNSTKASNAGANKKPSDPSKWKIQETPQDTSLIPTLAVTVWLGWNGIVILIFLYGAFLAEKWGRMVIIGCSLVSLVLPANFPGKGFFVGKWMMQEAEKYFGEQIVFVYLL